MNKVLVVCVGNVCRSPVGERVLQDMLPDHEISSAGIGALVGRSADATAKVVAESNGVTLEGHVARQFETEMAERADLVLVMESRHKEAIIRQRPQISGKIMLFDQWSGAQGIPDPFQMSEAYHELVFGLIHKAATAWAAKLSPEREQKNA